MLLPRDTTGDSAELMGRQTFRERDRKEISPVNRVHSGDVLLVIEAFADPVVGENGPQIDAVEEQSSTAVAGEAAAGLLPLLGV